MHYFANPARFLRLADRLFPFAAWGAALLLALGLAGALWLSPPDYQQGEAMRIMYIHVPAAWMSLMVYSIMAACSACFLIWKHPLAYVIASSSAGVGAAFTLITLVTGMLWGKPMWGTWWEWDARLTSMLVLFFLYMGYIALDQEAEGDERQRVSVSVLSLVGFVNVPIIKFSVDWWSTLHQPASILRAGGPSIHSSMLWPLLVMIAGFTLFYAALLMMRARRAILLHKLRRLQYMEAFDTRPEPAPQALPQDLKT